MEEDTILSRFTEQKLEEALERACKILKERGKIITAEKLFKYSIIESIRLPPNYIIDLLLSKRLILRDDQKKKIISGEHLPLIDKYTIIDKVMEHIESGGEETTFLLSNNRQYSVSKLHLDFTLETTDEAGNLNSEIVEILDPIIQNGDLENKKIIYEK